MTSNSQGDGRPPRSLALISNSAFSISNFRGPLVEAMVAAGVRVHALAPDFDEESRATIRALGAEPVDISLDRAGTGPFRELLDLARLKRVLRDLKPDAVFSYFAKPVIYGSLAAASARVPRRWAMVEGLGYVFNEHQDQRGLKRRILRRITEGLYKRAFARVERVFFLNQEDIDQFVGGGLLPPEKALKLGGIGVDLDWLRPAPPVLKPVTFVLAARLLREKGIVEFAEAARIVKAAHPGARFLLLGGLDPNPSGLRASEVEAWVAEGLLEWPGQVSDVREWIAASSVFVLPSFYREGVPRSIQEAMAMGRPIITTDNVGCRETVEEGVNGFLVPVRNAEALAEAMIRFIDRPELIAAMGGESRRLAEERFDVHRINAVILETFGIVPPRAA
ncbi:MAG TPA: glycosyltransferase family 4 protein [Allosphingosinicella sp.]|nr:glycosyltransferase family 4 protein [Allosphingosinicella sp.]